MKDFLVLPFKSDVSKLEIFNADRYNDFPKEEFKIYTKQGEMLPFICPIENIGCDGAIEVYTIIGEFLYRIENDQYKHKIIKNGSKKFVMFEGGTLPCFLLPPCNLGYYLKIGNMYSESFYVFEGTGFTKLEVGNATSFKNIPYNLGFKQWFWIQDELYEPNYETYRVDSKDEKGYEYLKYGRLIPNYTIFSYGVPTHIKRFFHSLEMLDTINLTDTSGKVFTVLSNQTKVKSSVQDNRATLFDTELSFVGSESTEQSSCDSSDFILDTTCPAIVEPTIRLCEPITPITDVEVGCLPNPIDDVEVDCCGSNNDIDFFATVTYESI
jgi:hypothetical protein